MRYGAPRSATSVRARMTSTFRCLLPSHAGCWSNTPRLTQDIVLLATLLHDIGWWAIDAKDIFERGFGPDMMQSDVRFLHEREGVRLSREILAATGNWSENVITSVGEIIDGHDTRPYPRSLNDRLMRDADKLWRFTVPGVAIACDWFKLSPRDYADRLQEDILPKLETELGRHLAEAELAGTRVALMMHVL